VGRGEDSESKELIDGAVERIPPPESMTSQSLSNADRITLERFFDTNAKSHWATRVKEIEELAVTVTTRNFIFRIRQAEEMVTDLIEEIAQPDRQHRGFLICGGVKIYSGHLFSFTHKSRMPPFTEDK